MPCEGMHGKRATSCWSLVEPYCTPYRCIVVVEEAGKGCRIGGAILGAGTHGEIRDATLAEAQEDQHCLGRKTASLD